MKKYITIILAVFFFFACGKGAKESAQMNKDKAEIEKLYNQIRKNWVETHGKRGKLADIFDGLSEEAKQKLPNEPPFSAKAQKLIQKAQILS